MGSYNEGERRDESKERKELEDPLLISVESREKLEGDYDDDDISGEILVENRGEIVKEVKKQLQLAGPLIWVNFLVFSLQLISTMFVGHLGELPLSGASMATSFASVTGFSLLTGLASALDTYCGQSYGAKQYHMLGIHKQRAMIVVLLVGIPLAFMWANTGNVLLFLGQDPEIAAEAGQYARYLIPSVFGYGLLQCHIKFLQAQNIVVPMMITAGFATLLHVFGCWLLVFRLGFGNKGAAISIGICDWIMVLILAVYVRVSPRCKETWTGFSMEAFSGIPAFLRLAIPSAIMMCLEIWSFEMVVLMSGLLPNPKLETSVLSISLNTCSTIYMMPLGLGAAVSTRVSNELGAGRPKLARLASYVSLLMVGVEGLATACVLILGHSYWGYCYSSEEEVVKNVGEMLFLLACSHLFEGIQTVLSGTARGCGWQKLGAIVNLGAYYLVGFPCAFLLAFVCHLAGKGLWMGIICALVVQASSLFAIVQRTNWDQQAEKATDRVVPNKPLLH